MCIAAAVGGAAVLGAYTTDRASKRAADAAESGADAAAATQRYMYDTTREDQAPYRTVGTSALNRIASMYGLRQFQDPSTSMLYNPDYSNLVEDRAGVPSVNAQLYATDPVYRKAWDDTLKIHEQRFGGGYSDKSNFQALEYDLRSAIESSPEYRQRLEQPVSAPGASPAAANDWSSFYDSPDYQFAFDEGNRAVNAGLAARGLSNSGAAMKELTRYGQGMASQQLNTYMNRLASLAGIGQTATQATGAAGANAAQGVSQAQMAAGDARASGYMNRASNINNLINQGTGMYMMSQLGGGGSGITQVAPQTYTTGKGYARIGG